MTRRRNHHACECGPDLPGQCPGPAHCPYSSLNVDLPDDINDTDDDPEDDDDTLLYLAPRDLYDRAIVGVIERANLRAVAYDADHILELLMEEHEWDIDEARDWFDYNMAGAHVGPKTPVFLYQQVYL